MPLASCFVFKFIWCSLLVWYVDKSSRNGIGYVNKNVQDWHPDSRRKPRFNLTARLLACGWFRLLAGSLLAGGGGWLLMGCSLAKGLSAGLLLAG